MKYLFRREKRQVFEWRYVELGNLAIKEREKDEFSYQENWVRMSTLQFDTSKPDVFF